jgi:hypothetical protein
MNKLVRTRREVFGVGYSSANEAHEKARQLSEDPPKGWIKGSFKAQSQRTVHTAKRSCTITGDRQL